MPLTGVQVVSALLIFKSEMGRKEEALGHREGKSLTAGRCFRGTACVNDHMEEMHFLLISLKSFRPTPVHVMHGLLVMNSTLICVDTLNAVILTEITETAPV